MITLEQVEKLREKANVSYDEAKAALEAANGDMLEALINLEKQGKVVPPEGGGYYRSTGEKNDSKEDSKASKKYASNRDSLADLIRRFVRFCGMLIHKGNINSIEVLKDGEVKTAFSVTVLVVLALCFFWITIPLLVIGLFLGYRYRFKGPDLGKDSVNSAMDTAAEAAENLKKTFTEGHQNPNQ
ncbi:MAG TPA: DUF4342 domain-containing protein [Bacillota bacterium]|jgi:hypothetical protein|nr:DUF4342 domain-containing protein [Bacillota bacterium]HPZ59164.1 DUF4342 domain-containing protein [Bacillota bacterium]HQC82791.1 DUF4342 domain-containing protein [Bacillota bacterium]